MEVVILGFVVLLVVSYAIGRLHERRHTRTIVKLQRESVFNALEAYRLGDGEAAQVCIPIKRLNAWRKSFDAAESNHGTA